MYTCMCEPFSLYMRKVFPRISEKLIITVLPGYEDWESDNKVYFLHGIFFLLLDFVSLCSSSSPLTKTFHEIQLRVQFSTVCQDSQIGWHIKKRILTQISMHQKSV